MEYSNIFNNTGSGSLYLLECQKMHKIPPIATHEKLILKAYLRLLSYAKLLRLLYLYMRLLNICIYKNTQKKSCQLVVTKCTMALSHHEYGHQRLKDRRQLLTYWHSSTDGRAKSLLAIVETLYPSVINVNRVNRVFGVEYFLFGDYWIPDLRIT